MPQKPIPVFPTAPRPLTRTLFGVCFLILGMALGTGVASATEIDSDPVIDGVLEMLAAELSDDVVLAWLEGSPERPRRPTASEMVALKRAGASDALLRRLLELAGPGATEEPSAPPPPAASPTTPAAATTVEPRPATPASPPPSDPAAVVPPAVPPVAPVHPPAPSEGVPVTFDLSYAPDVDEDAPEWDLFVYLDSEPLTLVPASSPLFGRRPLRFVRPIEPGRHVVRIVQERHERRGPNRWLHLARVAPESLEIDLDPGTPATFELHFRQGVLQGPLDPLTFRWLQGEDARLDEGFGGDPDDWSIVCEELQTNTKANGDLPRSLRPLLEDCVGWASLWPEGSDAVPTREQIRNAMEAYRFRPVADPER